MAWKFLLPTRQFAVLATKSIPKYTNHISLVQKSIRDDDIQVLKCSEGSKKPDKPDKLTEHELNESKVKLCNITDNFFYQKRLEQIQFIHPEIFMENKINGTICKGFGQYYKYLGTITVYGHLRFAYVNSEVLNSWINEQEQSVSIRFQFVGLGFLEMAIKYLPKKLYKKQNIRLESRIWLDAISKFYLDPEGRIIKHVVDNKDVDQEAVKRPIDEIKEKLAKLKNAPTAAPALTKKL